ncbi:MAG: sulfotransferase family 2 domain-containing protein [Pseudomonadota bacterium]
MSAINSPAPAPARRVMYSSLEGTQTSLSGWFTQQNTSGDPPLVDIVVGGQLLQKTYPHPTAGNQPPAWKLGCQWLQPIAIGTPLELRVSATGQRLAAAQVDGRDGKHSMYSTAFNYAVFYNPKSACTSLRHLFFALHADEIDPQRAEKTIRSAPSVFPLPKDRPPQFKINVVRDPYKRLVSAFIDKVASLFYCPQLSTGHDVYRWRFGPQTDAWGELTFQDFLDYLALHRDFSDIHFQTQPVIAGDVELVYVEQFEAQLCEVYQRRQPALLDRVKTFFSSPAAHANQSVLARLSHRVELPDAHNRPVRELAEIIKSGKGFASDAFISEATLPALNALLEGEILAHGFRLRPMPITNASSATSHP